MPKTIWKFDVLPGREAIPMPEGAKILDIQVQNGAPVIWAIVDPEKKAKSRFLYVYGTGHMIPDDPGKYVGTFQFPNDGLVFHAFERTTHDHHT